MTATLREKGQVTIPAEIRRAAGLREGALLEFDVVAGGVLVRPALVVDEVEVDEEFARRVIETTTRGFERLRANRAAWQAEVRERALLDSATQDRLEDA